MCKTFVLSMALILDNLRIEGRRDLIHELSLSFFTVFSDVMLNIYFFLIYIKKNLFGWAEAFFTC